MVMDNGGDGSVWVSYSRCIMRQLLGVRFFFSALLFLVALLLYQINQRTAFQLIDSIFYVYRLTLSKLRLMNGPSDCGSSLYND